ncbi:MAG: hypothetical protein GY851_23580 [bacterium]|nr:hypothetical protein [bacterium]
MDDQNERLVDGLERLPEAALDRAGAPDELRDALRTSTARAVRGRARRRRVAWWSGGLAVAYAAGLWTMTLAPPDPGAPVQTNDPPVHEVQPAGEVVETVVPETLPRITVAAVRDPELLARTIGMAQPNEKARLLRDAGDLYLDGMGDIRRATQCYRRALREENQDVEYAAGTDHGTWLYLSLKEQWNEETHHANDTI